MVAHSFQVSAGFHHCDDLTQICCNWLLQSNQFNTIVFKLMFHFIDLYIFINDLLSQLFIMIRKSFDRFIDGFINAVPHLKKLTMQFFEFLIIRSSHNILSFYS